MQLTIDSSDDLEQVLAAVGALFGVRLELAEADADEPEGALLEGDEGSDEQQQLPVEPVTDEAGDEQAGEEQAEPEQAEEASAEEPDAEEPKPARRRRRAAAPQATTAEIRAWARENGHRVSDRGRMPAEVVAAYEAAHA